MGHYYSLLMINKEKFMAEIKGFSQEDIEEFNIPPEAIRSNDFKRMVELLHHESDFYFLELEDTEAMYEVWELGEVKAHGLRNLFINYMSREYARIMLESESGYPLEIVGKKVLEFIKQMEIISVKLREIDTSQLDDYETGQASWVQEIFDGTVKELHKGLRKGYKDAIAVICG